MKKEVLKTYPDAVCLEDHYSDLFLVYSNPDFSKAIQLTGYPKSGATSPEKAWKEAYENIINDSIPNLPGIFRKRRADFHES